MTWHVLFLVMFTLFDLLVKVVSAGLFQVTIFPSGINKYFPDLFNTVFQLLLQSEASDVTAYACH